MTENSRPRGILLPSPGQRIVATDAGRLLELVDEWEKGPYRQDAASRNISQSVSLSPPQAIIQSMRYPGFSNPRLTGNENDLARAVLFVTFLPQADAGA